MARKRKTLPKDFQALLQSGDLAAMQTVFDDCELTAYERPGYGRTALHFRECPDDLARWLVGQGLDVDTRDHFGNTALHSKVLWGEGVDVLLELGADVNAVNNSHETPLHAAVPRNPESVRKLLAHGADMTASWSSEGPSLCDVAPPLQEALQRCPNSQISFLAQSARILLDAGAPVPPNAAEEVIRIGRGIQTLRRSWASQNIRDDETDHAMSELYAMFGVRPVAPVRVHDGVSPITVTATVWQEQFNELWDYLVPMAGFAATKQGEVIRAAGRIARELLDNGGINWNREHRAMRDALIRDLASGTPVANAAELARLARGIRRDGFSDHAVNRVSELAVAWVLANPIPVRCDQTPVSGSRHISAPTMSTSTPAEPDRSAIESVHNRPRRPSKARTALRDWLSRYRP